MGEQENEIGFIEVMIVFHGVVDDDREENDRTAGNAINKSVREFVQPGFFIERGIRSYHCVEDEPADRYGNRTQPEAIGQHQLMVDQDGFRQQQPATEVKYNGSHQGCEIVAEEVPEDIDCMWFFMDWHDQGSGVDSIVFYFL